MESTKDTSKVIPTKEETQPKLTTINLNHIRSTEQKSQAQPTIPNIIRRSGQPPAATDCIAVNNPGPTRGSFQLQLPTHSIFPPHLCYGYVPTYHGFVSNSFTDYLTMDPSLFLRRQKPRTIFSAEQLKVLEATFKDNNYPSASTRKQVASQVGLPVDRVRVWFQNRRAKEKRLKEDRLALSLLTESPQRSLASTSRLHSELLSQKLHELKSSEKQETVEIDVEHNSESEEEIVRHLLKEAKAREDARNKVCNKDENQKCCTEISNDAGAEMKSRMTSIANGCQEENFRITEEERRHAEELANKMYSEHLRMLKELAKESERRDDRNHL